MTIPSRADILLPRERRRRERVAVGKRPESCRAVRGGLRNFCEYVPELQAEPEQ